MNANLIVPLEITLATCGLNVASVSICRPKMRVVRTFLNGPLCTYGALGQDSDGAS